MPVCSRSHRALLCVRALSLACAVGEHCSAWCVRGRPLPPPPPSLSPAQSLFGIWFLHRRRVTMVEMGKVLAVMLLTYLFWFKVRYLFPPPPTHAHT